jgi:hypothetical protein
MATTFQRIRHLLTVCNSNEKDSNPLTFSTIPTSKTITKDSNFIITKRTEKGLTQSPISKKAIQRILTLMKQLELINISMDGVISLTFKGRNALPETAFSNSITVAAYDFLAKNGIQKASFMNQLESHSYPKAEDLFNALKVDITGEAFNLDIFKRVLFLIACGGDISRGVRVYYEK